MSDENQGFVPLGALRAAQPDAARALAEIRKIYFAATKKTIQNDFARAIALLKSLGSEEEREKATVYMEGLAQLRKEWASARRPGRKKTTS